MLGNFPDDLDGKEFAFNTGDPGSTSGSGRFPGGGNDKPHHYSCLGNPMDKRAWQVLVHVVAKESDMT